MKVMVRMFMVCAICLFGLAVQPVRAECAAAHTHIGVNPTWRPADWSAPGVGSVDPDPTDDDQLWFFSLPPVHACATPGWPAWAQSDGSPFLLLSQVIEDGQPMVKPGEPDKTLYTCRFQYTKAGGYFARDGLEHIDGWHSGHGPQGAWNLESVDEATVPAWDIYVERAGVSENLAEDDFFCLLPDDRAVLTEDGATVSLEKRWLSDFSAWGMHEHMGFYFWLDAADDEVAVAFAAHDASGRYRRSADTTFRFARQVCVPVAGDVNHDGVVDVEDLRTVLDNFGLSGIVAGQETSYHDEDED